MSIHNIANQSIEIEPANAYYRRHLEQVRELQHEMGVLMNRNDALLEENRRLQTGEEPNKRDAIIRQLRTALRRKEAKVIELQDKLRRKLLAGRSLKDRNQDILKQRAQGKTLKAIGEDFGLSAARVRQIIIRWG